MNILILSYFFFPRNAIASFRINAMAKYLRMAGHSVTVITYGDHDSTDNVYDCKVFYLSHPILTETAHQELKKRGRWNLPRVLRNIENRMLPEIEPLWAQRAMNFSRKLISETRFDTILSSSGPMSTHRIAIALKKIDPGLFWIADARDELSRHPARKRHVYIIVKALEKKMLKHANLITSVSSPIIEDFKSMCHHDRFLLVRNGYDYDECHEVNFQPHFTLAYIGFFYYNITPEKFFKAFAELIQEGRLPQNSRIKIIGPNNLRVSPVEISHNIQVIKAVPHNEAIRISKYETDALVVIHPSGRKGVYTGKVFDYLATNKPILALCDPKDVVGDLIRETNSGFVVDENDHTGIKDAISRCYEIWKNKCTLPRRWDIIRQYTRRNQIQILIDYLSSLTGNASDR